MDKLLRERIAQGESQTVEFKASFPKEVIEFDDRIEFFNPGDLYDGLTVEQLESNNYKSKTRNKLIALMFKECGLIEKYGSRIGRIKSLCKEHGIVEPKFEERQKGFHVVLYKQKIVETIQETKKISTRERMILALTKDPSLTRDDLSTILSVSANAIKQHLSKLKNEGRIKRVGSTKAGYWEVLDEK